MGRGPHIMQNGKVVPIEQLQAFTAKYAVEAVLRYSEGLGKGPRFTRASGPDSVDIMWHWNEIPEGLPEDSITADVTIRLQYFPDPIGKLTIFHFFSPYCPDAAQKNQICKDAREIFIIELAQKGLLNKEAV